MSSSLTAGYFIGLMTGTSLDAVDTVLLQINNDGQTEFLDGITPEIPDTLRQSIQSISHGITDRIDDICRLDICLVNLYADCVGRLLSRNGLQTGQIIAIGSHGQTVRHCPDCNPPYTLQLGNGERLAGQTGITCVSDFRQRDMLYGGQGAPLAPLFHHHLFFKKGINRIVINLGGIANISILHQNGDIEGLDTGPANILMDQWIRQQQQQRYDKDAHWARSGQLHPTLLARLLDEPWLQQKPPKSTGPELFNLKWLGKFIGDTNIAPEDIQRTLCEYSAVTIADAIHSYAPDSEEAIICGGGTYNPLLIERLRELSPAPIFISDHYGISPDWVEAGMFAWLAWRTLNGMPGNIPAVTGADRETILGAIHSISADAVSSSTQAK